ncbi:MAG: hypothetical protein DWQ10_16990 [Calditrichaeota bacterium]|nr:MAG: hypothetical protein DWQ10_16990 [Calditrichota bacterium]
MALMERMRGFTKVVLYVLVFAFVGTIIFDWGMNITGLRQNPRVIGSVNGEEVDTAYFNNVLQQEMNRYSQQTGGSVPESQQQYIIDQVWEQIVREILMNQEIQKRNLMPSAREIAFNMRNNPPEFIRSDTSFATNGRFDQAKYDLALQRDNYQANINYWTQVEEYVRYMIPRQKLQDNLMAGIFVTDKDVKQEYLKSNQEATVEYISVPPSKFNDTEIELTDDQISAYYEEHEDSYREQLKRKIEFVIYSNQATKEDSALVEKEVQDLYEQAKSGADFAELAITNSDDNSAEQGGDLGFFKRDAMVKPFADAAFSAKIGEIVGPVRSQFGLHIINVVDKRMVDGVEEVRASHILRKFNASSNTVEAARDSAAFFAAVAQEDGWEKALEEEKVPSQTSTFFTKGSGFIPGLGLERTISKFVFQNQVGTVSDFYETNQGFAVVKIVDEQQPRTKKLEEVKGLIENALKTEKRWDLAKEFAENLKAEIDKGTTFEALASTESVTHEKPEKFNRNAFIANVGKDPVFIGTAFKLAPGTISDPVRGTRAYYIIKSIERSDYDDADFKAKKEAIRQDLLTRKQQQAFNQWYAALKKDAEIVDNRKEFLQY